MTRDAGGARCLDDHFFFEPRSTGQPLYAFTHVPIGGQPRMGVVIVPPIGRERLRICHEVPALGRDLAAAGFPVIRFDYRGEGESGGEFRESTVSSRVEDTVAAADELKRRTEVDQVALVGMHLGAAVAVLAARRARADWLVLGDPVCDPRAQARNLLRASILQQGQYFGRAAVSEADVRARLRAGGAITAFGFHVAAPLVDELESLDLDVPLREFSGRSLIVYFAPKGGAASRDVVAWGARLGAPSRCVLCGVPMSFSWTTRKRWTRRLGPLNDAIARWLRMPVESQEAVAGGECRGRR